MGRLLQKSFRKIRRLVSECESIEREVRERVVNFSEDISYELSKNGKVFDENGFSVEILEGFGECGTE